MVGDFRTAVGKFTTKMRTISSNSMTKVERDGANKTAEKAFQYFFFNQMRIQRRKMSHSDSDGSVGEKFNS
jgi:hypothetical protein